MNGPPPESGASPAARLLARERQISALEAGSDLLIEGEETRGQWGLISATLQYDPARLGLLFVPDVDHPLIAMARRPADIPVAVVTPDLSEAGRRDLGVALRNKTLQLLVVTLERLSQPRFIQFIRAQHPSFVAVASVQRLCAEHPEYAPACESLRALRALFPGVAVLALADEGLTRAERTAVCAALALQAADAPPEEPAPTANAPAAPKDTAPPAAPRPEAARPQPAPAKPRTEPQGSETSTTPQRPPAPAAALRRTAPPAAPPPEGAATAFALFENNMPVPDVARELGRGEDWVYGALTAFIRHSGRTHPFPWIDKPVYLRVSMAAGQAESTNPRLIASVLGGQVPPRIIDVVLAALDNRRGPENRHG
jgi:hypothetical protein